MTFQYLALLLIIAYITCLFFFCRERGDQFSVNWTKMPFMVKEKIVLGHYMFFVGYEMDCAKIVTIEMLPPPTNMKDVMSFLGHT